MKNNIFDFRYSKLCCIYRWHRKNPKDERALQSNVHDMLNPQVGGSMCPTRVRVVLNDAWWRSCVSNRDAKAFRVPGLFTGLNASLGLW
jgi:hypothetical protein